MSMFDMSLWLLYCLVPLAIISFVVAGRLCKGGRTYSLPVSAIRNTEDKRRRVIE